MHLELNGVHPLKLLAQCEASVSRPYVYCTHPASSDCGVGVGPFSVYTPRLEMPLVPTLADKPALLSP